MVLVITLAVFPQIIGAADKVVLFYFRSLPGFNHVFLVNVALSNRIHLACTHWTTLCCLIIPSIDKV